MGDKNIRKETKKKPKSDSKTSSATLRPILPQPEVVKRKDKDK